MRTKLNTYDGGSGGSLKNNGNGGLYSNQYEDNSKNIFSSYKNGMSANNNNGNATANGNSDSLSRLYGGYGNNSNSNSMANKNADDGNSSMNAYDDALAELARQGNYEAYWNKTVQLGNIQRLAQKNMQNTLKQQGIATQGAGAIAGSQLSNAYMNAQAGALKDFNDNESQITEDAYNRAETAKQNQLSEYQNLLATASQNGNVSETLQKIFESNPNMDDETRQKLNALAVAYDNTNSENASRVSTFQQYMQMANESGNLEKWYSENVLNNSDLTDKEKTELQRYYNAMGGIGDSFLSSVGVSSNNRFTTIDDLKNSALDDTILDNKVGHELIGMQSFIATNNVTEPTLFILHSDHFGKNVYVYYDPNNGSYVRLNRNQATRFNGDIYFSYGKSAKDVQKNNWGKNKSPIFPMESF